jgi:hypothetical protein
MAELDELILTEPRRQTGRGLAASRTLRGDLAVRMEGFHWTARTTRSARVRNTDGWSARAALDGEVVARGTVADVRVDRGGESATLAVAPPSRVVRGLEPAEP